MFGTVWYEQQQEVASIKGWSLLKGSSFNNFLILDAASTEGGLLNILN